MSFGVFSGYFLKSFGFIFYVLLELVNGKPLPLLVGILIGLFWFGYPSLFCRVGTSLLKSYGLSLLGYVPSGWLLF